MLHLLCQFNQTISYVITVVTPLSSYYRYHSCGASTLVVLAKWMCMQFVMLLLKIPWNKTLIAGQTVNNMFHPVKLELLYTTAVRP